VAEHISRKELKQDKIHDAIEHGAEAGRSVISTSVVCRHFEH